jgi:hypothetical protein
MKVRAMIPKDTEMASQSTPQGSHKPLIHINVQTRRLL